MFANALLDPVGFATLAILSGLGGGVIRDTLLQRGTPVALTEYAYILTALTANCSTAGLTASAGPQSTWQHDLGLHPSKTSPRGA